MGTKKSFLFYYDWCDIFEPLSNEKKGELITAIIDFAKNEAEPGFSDLALQIAFNVIRNTVKRDVEKYNERCLKNAENIRKRWQKNTNEYERIRMDTNYTDKDKDKDTDTDKDKDKDKDKDTDTDTDTDKDNISFSSKTACVYSDDFLIFWSAYPKKVGKGEAFKQWKKARLSTRDKKDIITALDWQKKTDRWRSSNGRYVPNPATYISQRRWEDEPCENNGADITNPDRYNEGDVLPDFIMRGDY
ncbi:MAG: hypothetical protein J6D06_10205 [Clostridia bacterium]|nr:hypothetical protein [Clostridia bacterium]